MNDLLHLVKSVSLPYWEALEDNSKGSTRRQLEAKQQVEEALTELLLKEGRPIEIDAVGKHRATVRGQEAWEAIEGGIIGEVAKIQVGMPRGHILISVNCYRQGEQEPSGILWHINLRDISDLHWWYSPSKPADDKVQAVADMRRAYEDFIDKLLTVVETDSEMTVLKVSSHLVKTMFMGDMMLPTYKDDKGVTRPSTIADAIELTVFATDVVGDQQTFGLLLSELECFGRDWEVREEWAMVTGKTFGDLLRGAVMRCLIQMLLDDEESLG